MRIFKMLLMSPEGGEGGGGSGTGGGSGDSGSGGSGTGTGGGSGDGGDPLFGGSSGGQGGSGESGNGSGGDKGGAQGGGGNNPGGQGGKPNPVVIPENWKDALPDELKGEASLNIIKDIPSLAKSYITAQKHIGADKVVIPGKSATDADWKEAFHKLGNPRDIKEYNIELDKDTKVDKEFFEQFKTKAHELGVIPRQAKQMVEWFAKLNKQVNDTVNLQAAQNVKADMAKLKNEWGSAWDANIVRAKAALMEYVPKEAQDMFGKLGLGQNPAFLKMMSKIGEGLTEDAIRRHTNTDVNPGAMAPAQAQAKIDEIKADRNHAYWNASDPGHAKAKKEMDALFQSAYPKAK